jgi:hypothetical protein
MNEKGEKADCIHRTNQISEKVNNTLALCTKYAD